MGSPVPVDADYRPPLQPTLSESEDAVLIDTNDSDEKRFSDRPLSDYDWSNSELEGFRCGKVFDQEEDNNIEDPKDQDDDDDDEDKDATGVEEGSKKEGARPTGEGYQRGVGINYSFDNQDGGYNSESSSVGTTFSTNVGPKGTADGDCFDNVGNLRRVKCPQTSK
ncbi:hypothetical protein E2562_038144 [Oryza meyeriana var. granulata]|uniref:Uncharacterized protein n=1 Tax=Oryza meyeriana var. granulata TaxID=110450 RepID=A0A6G1BQN6_9ORYZ|nr:hypothetical protein E2562_038144 [Oryza meyeriana var. granulata]